jgi:transcription elongation factor Elf1
VIKIVVNIINPILKRKLYILSLLSFYSRCIFMSLKVPSSMEECLYFTNRSLEPKGSVLAWVYRKTCPKCKKAKMGKPVEKGKVKTRADEYVCPSCGYSEEKVVHEESLILDAKYSCPKCGKSGESSGAYKRKMFLGIPSYVVECSNCGEKIPLTKKMKNLKKKDKKDVINPDSDDDI